MKQGIETSYTSSGNVGSMVYGIKRQSCEWVTSSPLQLGSTRQDCSTYLTQRSIASINFAHWLAIPTLQLLLVFRGQHCIAIEKLTPPAHLT